MEYTDDGEHRSTADQQCSGDNSKGPGCGAPAPLPALPCQEEDNCTEKSPSSWRSRFVAEKNIEYYIEKFTPEFVGLLTVTTPSACLSAVEFQKKWHSWRSHDLRKLFPTGVWVRERQPRTGNWHCHAVVNVGWDIKTGFPWDQVNRRLYGNVDLRLRSLWKTLRESAPAYGFGRVELLPLKTVGWACARYLVKYLLKRTGSDKLEGEEKCHLFGLWGGVRYATSNLSLVKFRIGRKRSQWLAEHFGISEEKGIGGTFGPHWWFHLGATLSEVIMPVRYYQVPDRAGSLDWDDLGFGAYHTDVARFVGPGQSIEDGASHSQHRLFHEVGKLLFGRRSDQALAFAHSQMVQRPHPSEFPDPRLLSELRNAALREEKKERAKGDLFQC